MTVVLNHHPSILSLLPCDAEYQGVLNIKPEDSKIYPAVPSMAKELPFNRTKQRTYLVLKDGFMLSEWHLFFCRSLDYCFKLCKVLFFTVKTNNKLGAKYCFLPLGFSTEK